MTQSVCLWCVKECCSIAVGIFLFFSLPFPSFSSFQFIWCQSKFAMNKYHQKPCSARYGKSREQFFPARLFKDNKSGEKQIATLDVINQNYLVYVRIIPKSLADSRCKIERLSDGFFCDPPAACSSWKSDHIPVKIPVHGFPHNSATHWLAYLY